MDKILRSSITWESNSISASPTFVLSDYSEEAFSFGHHNQILSPMTGFSLFPQIRGWMWFGSDHLYIKAVILSLLSNMERVFLATKQSFTSWSQLVSSCRRISGVLHTWHSYLYFGSQHNLVASFWITISFQMAQQLWYSSKKSLLSSWLGEFTEDWVFSLWWLITWHSLLLPAPHDSESLLFWSPCAWLPSTWTIHLFLPSLSPQKHFLPLGRLLMPLLFCTILSKCYSQLQF